MHLSWRYVFSYNIPKLCICFHQLHNQKMYLITKILSLNFIMHIVVLTRNWNPFSVNLGASLSLLQIANQQSHMCKKTFFSKKKKTQLQASDFLLTIAIHYNITIYKTPYSQYEGCQCWQEFKEPANAKANKKSYRGVCLNQIYI